MAVTLFQWTLRKFIVRISPVIDTLEVLKGILISTRQGQVISCESIVLVNKL